MRALPDNSRALTNRDRVMDFAGAGIRVLWRDAREPGSTYNLNEFCKRLQKRLRQEGSPAHWVLRAAKRGELVHDPR